MTSADDDMLATVSLQEYLALKAERDTLAASVEYHKGMAAKWESEAKADLVRIRALEAALRGLLDAFKTDEIDDFTAYAEPIPTAIHAARAVLAADEREGEQT